MADADELFAEADHCRRLADEADPLTQRILLELAEQYENEAHLLLVYPPPELTGSGNKATAASIASFMIPIVSG